MKPDAIVLARLEINGAVLDVTDLDPGDAEGFVPKLGADNKLSDSVLPGSYTPAPGSIKAEDVAFDVAPEHITEDNVRDAINELTKDTGGLACMRASNLGDLGDTRAGFTAIKQPAETIISSDIYAGAVGLADQTTTRAGTDTYTDSSLGASVPLVVVPSHAKTTYLSKVDTGSQTLAGALVLAGAPTIDLHPATKKYVDDSISATISIPVGKTVWVDSVNGNNSTATRGIMTKPALTLAAARDLAVSGDLIIVGPGTYDENDLAKAGINWYFQPNAKIHYTGGGDNSKAIFHMDNIGCHISGYGEFKHQLTTGVTRYVLYLTNNAYTVFECRWVESTTTAIYVDGGTNGYASIRISDTLASKNADDSSGACAAKLLTGKCDMVVGREIYSNGSESGQGLTFGSGSTITGYHSVRCPHIWGKYNAVTFAGPTVATVDTDYCTSSLGSTVKSILGLNNSITARQYLSTSSGSYSPLYLTGGNLTVIDTPVLSTAGANAINMNGTPYTSVPYLVLKSCEIWTGGTTPAVVSNFAEYRIRLAGYLQSDVAAPNGATVELVGGSWEHIENGYDGSSWM